MASTSIGFDNVIVKVKEPASSATSGSFVISNAAVSSFRMVYVVVFCVPTVIWLPVRLFSTMLSSLSTTMSPTTASPGIVTGCVGEYVPPGSCNVVGLLKSSPPPVAVLFPVSTAMPTFTVCPLCTSPVTNSCGRSPPSFSLSLPVAWSNSTSSVSSFSIVQVVGVCGNTKEPTGMPDGRTGTPDSSAVSVSFGSTITSPSTCTVKVSCAPAATKPVPGSAVNVTGLSSASNMKSTPPVAVSPLTTIDTWNVPSTALSEATVHHCPVGPESPSGSLKPINVNVVVSLSWTVTSKMSDRPPYSGSSLTTLWVIVDVCGRASTIGSSTAVTVTVWATLQFWSVKVSCAGLTVVSSSGWMLITTPWLGWTASTTRYPSDVSPSSQTSVDPSGSSLFAKFTAPTATVTVPVSVSGGTPLSSIV